MRWLPRAWLAKRSVFRLLVLELIAESGRGKYAALPKALAQLP